MTDTKDLTVSHNASLTAPSHRESLPAIIYQAGNASRNAWDDFFGTIQNRYTRAAYEHSVRKFLAWLPQDLAPEQIRPAMVGRYLVNHPGSIPTRKLHLAAIRAFFDLLVERHIVLINPAASVRGPRHEAVEGKTPEIGVQPAKQLLASIPIERSTKEWITVPLPVGLRDKAIIATLIYTAARAGAVARLRLKDFRCNDGDWTLRFTEKRGKVRDIPVRHDLKGFILAYLMLIPDWQSCGDEPMFRTAIGKTNVLTTNAMSNIDVCRMLKRRLRLANLPLHLSPHSLRTTTITDLLSQGVPLEAVQYLVGHSDSRTTQLYDRRQKQVTRNIVERISI